MTFCPLHLGEDLVPLLIEGCRGGVDPVELFPGCQAGFVIHAGLVHRRDVAEAADPDHIEFIQIAGKN